MTRVSLISVLDRPRAISRSTSVSRWVSAPSAGGNGGFSRGRRAKSAISGRASHHQAWLGGEYRGEALSHHRLVVGDQAPRGCAAAFRAARRHAVSRSGRTADTTKPPPGAGPADKEPPSSATRSRIPVSP